MGQHEMENLGHSLTLLFSLGQALGRGCLLCLEERELDEALP